jgi:glycosyltransferase involved in cell wall biosynthesis
MIKKDILFVCSVIDMEKGAGTAERTFQLVNHLKNDFNIGVLTTSRHLSDDRVKDLAGCDLKILKILLARFNLPIPEVFSLIRLIRVYKYVHLIGHWDFLNLYVFYMARLMGVKVIFTPAGALPYFGRNKVLKRIYNYFGGRSLITKSDVKVCITKAEKEHFVHFGVPTTDLFLMPNGVDIDSVGISYLPSRDYFLYLGRLNYIKGVDLLLENYMALDASIKNKYRLLIVGPDSGLKAPMLKLLCKNDLNKDVTFVDFVEGTEKTDILRNAFMTIVPSRQEAMSLVALESIAQNTPVVASNNCGLDEFLTFDEFAEFRLEDNSMTTTIKHFVNQPEFAGSLLKSQRSLLEEKYTWKSQIAKLLQKIEL